MMTRPQLLDLFAGEGGAGEGYRRAGFEVVGVELDSNRARRNPGEVIVGDAMVLGPALLASGRFTAVHASPPCQAYSRATVAGDRSGYTSLIHATRDMLVASGLPYVIENVEGARAYMRAPLMLCGSEFGLVATDDDGRPLQLQRHRLFESNQWLWGAGGCCHSRAQVAGSYGGASRSVERAKNFRHGGYVPSAAVQRVLLGIGWMTVEGMCQSIPPAYTEFIGQQLMSALVPA